MIRPIARTLLAVATVFALLCVAPAPANAVTHTGPNWSWDGPADWTAAYGTYGITVTPRIVALVSVIARSSAASGSSSRLPSTIR